MAVLLDPFTYVYNNATMQRNKDPPQRYPGNYSTDLISSKAIEFLEEAAAAKAPFFLGVMPIVPHTQTILSTIPGGLPVFEPPDLYHGVKVPRTDNFNPDNVITYNDEFYRLRLAALASVDDHVDAMFERLESFGLMNNIYIIYTSDNGFPIGQHRLALENSCAYEEDVNVPMFIRGTGVPKGEVVTSPTSHTDIVPTLFDLAGIPLLKQFDGAPVPVKPSQLTCAKTEHINIEFWGNNFGEGIYAGGINLNNTYKDLHVVGDDYDIACIVWCTNEHELYDMKTDPGHMKNLWNATGAVGNYTVGRLQPRLDALLMVLKSCKGQVCVKPWEILHPRGDVKRLGDAMNPKYEGFYASQPKVAFEECALGYFPEVEGSQKTLPYISNEV
ncbi:hypothetical protein GGP41_005356 [Bipolaris sorokiniana]|uniref:Sulfatase N-terminal domain-containing protein n=1 Tax=Cochliobolus sativus TaxID=45130 RepID=A0A8H5ZIF2_COCSA|nr:hypothetical protein GGP41_005356 [Bipolaris sorokiniana]